MLKRRRTGVVVVAAGVALVAFVLTVTSRSPWLSEPTAKTDASPEPARSLPPATGSMLSCGDTKSKLSSYPDRGISLPQLKLPAREVHPRAQFSSADIPLLRARANGMAPDPHKIYSRDWTRIQEDVLDGDVGGDSDDDINSRRAKAYGFAYVITGKEAYRDVALASLSLAFRKFDSEDQYIAAQMTNYAQAYDYIGGSVPAGSARDTVARAAIERGARWLEEWLEGQGERSKNSRPHNHRSKVALALGMWALVFSADDNAAERLELAVDQLNTVYRYMFTRDGVYLDGYGYYWAYQLFQVVPFLYAARNIAGVDLFPAMQPVFEWMVRDSSPQGWLMNIEDGWIKTVWTAVVATPYLQSRTRLSRSEPLGKILQWRFFQQDWNAPRYPRSWTGQSSQAYLWPDELIHIDQRIPEVAPDADFDFYRDGANTTVMRSDWKHGDPATRWLMFYGAPMSNNHDHCDTMQVLLNAENTVMLTDNGYGPERFPRRDDWWPAKHHNVVTMDGTAARDVFDNTVNLDGAATDYSEKLAYFDQTRPGVPGSQSWRRGVLFPAHHYAVISDTLRAPQEQTWRSYLHARGTLDRQDLMSVWTTPDNVFGASAKLYAMTLPASARTEVKSGRTNLFGGADEPPDTEPGEYLETTQSGTDSHYLTIAVPRPRSASPPQLADLSSGPVLAATVRYDGHTDTLLKQPGAAPRSAGELSTNGRLAWSRQTGGALRGWSVVGGSDLSYAGQRQMSASSRLSVTADLASGRPVVDIQAGNGERYAFSVAGNHPVATFAGTPVTGTSDRGLTTFQLTGSGRLVLGAPAPVPANPPSAAPSGPADAVPPSPGTAPSAPAPPAFGDGRPSPASTPSARLFTTRADRSWAAARGRGYGRCLPVKLLCSD